MTQADWVKEIEEIYQEIRKEIMVSNGAVMVNWDDGTLKVKKPNGRIMIKELVSLAQQRTEKKWRESPPEIKTELPFSVTINGVPHILTSISEQNFASLLRFGGEIDGKIILTFTRSDLLK